MSAPDSSFDRAWPLIEAACLGTITDREARELQDYLRGDAELQRLYLEYCRMHAELRYQCRAAETNDAVLARIAAEGRADRLAPVEAETAPRRSARMPSSVLGSLAGAYQGTAAYFSERPMLFGYLVASVCLVVAALIGSMVQVSHYRELAHKNSRSLTDSGKAAKQSREMIFVGRITGMADVKWSQDPDYLPPAGVHVSLGREYILVSGLMEITYDTGAKVILEGPCNYKVDSARGGYLALGKLTAKVETKGSGARGQRSEKANLPINKSSNQQISNPQSLIPNPFVVSTPTATITDLGTEFGVEVSTKGYTISHVYSGLVRVQPVSDRGRRKGTVLKENETARVERGGADDEPRMVFGENVGAPPKFARRLYEPPKLLDLLDIVAGGDGTGNRRERGVNPVTGRQDLFFASQSRGGNYKYRPVPRRRFIDGVFVLNGGADVNVQLDSAGHTFDQFTFTSGKTFGSIWARAAEIEPEQKAKYRHCWMYAMGRGERFMPEGRGLLGLHPNAGITFDLEAIRRVYRDAEPSGFRALAGIADATAFQSKTHVMADLWVFVDGRLMLKPTRLRPENKPVQVNVPLGPGDRFLTIVSTDGCDGYEYDWVVLGDPVLEMTVAELE